jgi:hypothetical protein
VDGGFLAADLPPPCKSGVKKPPSDNGSAYYLIRYCLKA